ncbi:MAG: DUF239 domain-containing protein [Streptosporangiales bacterium]|nr:DUF239 domain-containing protein [Streptosporangiales bacterium]
MVRGRRGAAGAALAVAFTVGGGAVLSAATFGPLRGAVPAGGREPVSYTYAYGRQYAVSEGVRAHLSVHRPRVPGPDHHSLTEIAVQSADGRQAIEVGWTVNRALYGDTQPRLFVYHWVDGEPACYNACGYVQDHPEVGPGLRLRPGARKRFAVRYRHGRWLIGYGDVWFGHYPAELWGGRFTRSGLVQWFGEVSGPRTPCAEMGSGRHARSAAAATVTGIAYYSGPRPRLTVATTGTPGYTVHRTAPDAFRYGGPGPC